MDSKLLMIGDWVYSSFFGKTWITSLKEYEGYGWVMTSGNENWKSDASLSPILLTAEILEKNGGRVKNVCDGYDEWTVEIESFSSWWLLTITKEVDGGYEYNIDSFPIHYVHELQHALRLCGLNDLADNFKI